ncbi:FAD-linked oxidoreductase-like protein [Plectosphaerella cucumerina]|uniref:Proline dehydrogenase n=1 Tax=Plectosphaerella cucumerina TaxID=40658 RepID=A0A8K0X6B7_9PEZI|nr:FAD-linked oxidoreductase-like protein [Plectosphaerella cucumerina]
MATIHSSPSRRLTPSSSKENLVAAPQNTMPSIPPLPPPAPFVADAPLAVLPLHMILRSLLTTTVSSSPVLLPPSLAIMSLLANTTLAPLNPDRNPALRWFMKKTFYAQFCAGETPDEVAETIARLKRIGFTGVILGYAKEVVLTEEQTKELSSCGDGEVAEACIRDEIMPFTGAGRQALYSLSERLPASAALAQAIDEVCARAASRGVRLLFDAEQAAVQDGIDDWTLEYMKKYNTVPGRAVIYGTYQAYRKSTPRTLATHLAAAQQGGFTLGVKLVRGAYLGSDPRELFHDTKDETDAAYNSIARSLLRREWGPVLRPVGDAEKAGTATFPRVSMVLASHNAESVRRGRAICEAGEAGIQVAFGQLQGMADEVSCELVSAKKAGLSGSGPAPAARGDETETEADAVAGWRARNARTLDAYKYLVWGSTGDCMKYLLRRAHENRDAVQRTRAGRDAMWTEVNIIQYHPLGTPQSHSAEYQAVHLVPLLVLVLDLVKPGQAIELVVLLELGHICDGSNVRIGEGLLRALNVLCQMLLHILCRPCRGVGSREGDLDGNEVLGCGADTKAAICLGNLPMALAGQELLVQEGGVLDIAEKSHVHLVVGRDEVEGHGFHHDREGSEFAGDALRRLGCDGETRSLLGAQGVVYRGGGNHDRSLQVPMVEHLERDFLTSNVPPNATCQKTPQADTSSVDKA